MLRFFRHIRQKLFLEGRVSKYLGYALGEIVLIVVGILIAVQIGEWNRERQNRIEERNILARISNEVAGHVSSINSRLSIVVAETKAALQHVIKSGDLFRSHQRIIDCRYKATGQHPHSLHMLT